MRHNIEPIYLNNLKNGDFLQDLYKEIKIYEMLRYLIRGNILTFNIYSSVYMEDDVDTFIKIGKIDKLTLIDSISLGSLKILEYTLLKHYQSYDMDFIFSFI